MEEKKARNKAKVKFEQAMEKLKLRLEDESTSCILIKTALDQVNKSWDVLDDAQADYIVEIDEGKQSEENKDFAKLDSGREEIVLYTEEVLVRKESGTTPKKDDKKDTKPNQSSDSGTTPEEDDKKDTKPNQSSESGTTLETDDKKGIKQGPSSGSGALNTVVNTTVAIAKDVGNKISNLLSGITVSKTKKEEFEAKLQDQLVDSWDEDTKCKVFHGVQVEKWDTFLGLFQKTTGIDEETRAAFEALPFTDAIDDQVKTFSCKMKDLKGKYGMFAIVKHGNGKVDVAYAVYSFKAEFVGAESQNKYKIWHSVKDEKTGLYRLTEPVVEDVLTGKMMKTDQRLKVGDVNSLSQNFIIAKALGAFAQSGVISRISYEEDMEIEGGGSRKRLN